MTFQRPQDVSRNESPEDIVRILQEFYETIVPYIRPTLAADLQKRIWQQRERLLALKAADQSEAPPLAARPRALPALLNPLYFTPKK